MASIQTPASTPASTSEKPARSLWEYQVRKENQAILQQIKIIGEKRDADVSENLKRLQEAEKRRLALEARVAEIEREQKRREERDAEYKKECSARLAEMEKFLRERLTGDELRKLISATTRPTANTHPSTSAPRPSHARPTPGHLNGQDNRREVEPTADTRRVHEAEAPEIPAPRPKQVANRRPATRNKSSGQDIPVQAKPISSTSAITSSPIPKLRQGHKSLKAYYEMASATFASLGITNPQMEYDFISAFIKGLDNKKTGDKVIATLQQIHPARNKLDGGIEIMCGWEDIPAGFKRAGLDVTGAKEEIKRKKRTLNPRTQLETGFGI